MITEHDGRTLLDRMRGGDREAAAEFMQRFGPAVRRRVRVKLGMSMRRVFDSEDVLSTVTRRLDEVVRRGRLRTETEAGLQALVLRILDFALREKVRAHQRGRRGQGSDHPLTHGEDEVPDRSRQPYPTCFETDSDTLMRSLDDDLDQEILLLRMHGNQLANIARSLGLEGPFVRKRWQRIHTRLAALERFGLRVGHEHAVTRLGLSLGAGWAKGNDSRQPLPYRGEHKTGSRQEATA